MKAKLLANWLLEHSELEVLDGFIIDDIEPEIKTAEHPIKSSQTGELLVSAKSEYIVFKKKE